MEGHRQFLGGVGILKAEFLEAMYENRLELPGGRGVQNKKPSLGGGGGGMDIFWNYTLKIK